MKFGSQLQEILYPEWRFYYLDYDGLKRMLKERLNDFTEKDEAKFVEFLEKELEKVYTFQTVKLGEINRRVEFSERTVQKLSKGSDASEQDYADVEEDINRVIAEVNELAKFTRLNYSGFLKIIKKHDKHTTYSLKPMFMVRLNARPFYKENFDTLLLKLSKLYDIVRNCGQAGSNKSAAPAGGSQNFIRQTTKYWVHPDNVMEVKLLILKYLPVLVYNAKEGGDFNPAVSSVYFDNESFDLYTGRLEKSEGAEAIRLRWYGNSSNNEIFVERKTHREDWTGEKSVKERFPLKEKYINDYLRGDFTMDNTIQKLRERGAKSEKELKELEQLSSEIQYNVITKKLNPTIRTFYNRTAFQLPGDARVRISLDTELTLIREDNLDNVERSGKNWRRTDIDTDYPFSQLADADVCRFPYAVLEVKLQTQHGTEPPHWVTNLVESHLVESVPKFSKYIHGVSTLLESRVSLLPFWLPQMDKDIRKSPNRELLSIKDSGSSHSNEDRASSYGSSRRNRSSRHQEPEIQVVVDGSYQRTDSSRSRGRELTDAEYDENAPLLRESRSRSRKANGAGFFSGLFNRSRTPSPDTPKVRQPAKRIAIPVRVEPKVFFANERTFLSWLHFTIVLGGLALGLLNFGDSVGQISGVLFTLISMGVMIYSLVLYQWRAEQIRQRRAGPYDDRFGPVILVVVLFFAVCINFYLKFTSNSISKP
ncbi:SPX-domain-containing protein [Basidiobolus meristosporus CBS 931.73]|uniref:Vacuolar transporter chaperone complex subunit 4 n=1 Tax=Basidiobolus meristosporus CBS 931.73 TaxID=1314790 RepID=A0A1Y1Z606_9FUNG|nr:SPX-domain-containing protein [Basidiobolus meristosporus CBS 931.73]|eukprot:ORY05427.1 SPX-domain-containing protein [Basidiobolus meristosporus CBS 931.73]